MRDILHTHGAMSKPRIRKEWSHTYQDYMWRSTGRGMDGIGFTAKDSYEHWLWRVKESKKAVL